MAQLTFKKKPGGSLIARVKASSNFTVEVTNRGYWLPSATELEGKLRPEKDFFDAKGEETDKVNRHLYNRVKALIRYLTEDLSQQLDCSLINAEKILTSAGNALYRAWFGKEKEEACYFFLSQNPKKKSFLYRTSSDEINFGSLMTRKSWVGLKDMIAAAKMQCKVVPVIDKDEKKAAMNAFFYSLELRRIKKESIDDYKKSADRRQQQQKPEVKITKKTVPVIKIDKKIKTGKKIKVTATK